MFECRHQPLVLPDDVANALAAAYREPHRAYHNLTHIAELLAWFDRVADDIGWQALATVYAAIVFHDAIYDPASKDNEAKSAAWAAREGYPDAVPLIEMTANHTAAKPGHDGALFLDADMAIVGAPAAQFDAYNAAIAREYSHVPADAFKAGRRAFLEKVLATPRIFHTAYFHDRLDAQARANLRRALAA
jgi:predicted metal-dependent HD superfamily phosphohydrolase